MAFKKKTKPAKGGVDGFDATPPNDGSVDISGNGRKNLYQHPALDSSKKGVKKFIASYKQFLLTSFRNAPRQQQENWVNRFAQICCIGISCIALNSFYSVLLPAIRIISLPILVGIAWLVANKLVAPAIIKRLGNNMSQM